MSSLREITSQYRVHSHTLSTKEKVKLINGLLTVLNEDLDELMKEEEEEQDQTSQEEDS